MRTLSENFEGFSQILKERSGKEKVFRCVNTPNSNDIKIWKCQYPTKKVCFSVLLTTQTCDFQTLQSNIFAKMKKVFETFFPVNMGPRLNPLKGQCHEVFDLYFFN